MELKNVFRILKRWFWLIGLFVLLTGIILFLSFLLAKPVYEAQVIIQISTPQQGNVSIYDEYVSVSSQSLLATARNNFMEVIKSKEVEIRTFNELEIEIEQDVYKMEIGTSSDSDFLIVTVEASTPELAASIANTLVEQAKKYSGELRAKPTIDEMVLYENELKIAEEAYNAAVEAFRTYKEINNIGKLDDEIKTSQMLLEQLQSDRNQQILIINTSEPISQINELILKHQNELDRLLAIEPMYLILEKNYQEARETYRLALAANIGPISIANAEEEYLNAEQAFNEYKSENNITSLPNEIEVSTKLIQQLQLDLDRRLMDDADRRAFLEQVDLLILERKKELERLSTLQSVYNVLEEKVIDAQKNYQHILSKYSEAELKATVVRAANFIQITEYANEPIKPKSNIKFFILGILGSLGLGIILAFLFDYFAGENEEVILTEKHDLKLILGLPVLGKIPMLKNSLFSAASPEADNVRQLYRKLLLYQTKNSLKIILITSPQPGDGKTITTANLGAVMAEGKSKVVIVDSDLRSPELHEVFDQPNLQGTAELLLADENNLSELLTKSIKSTIIPNLSIITAGKIPKDPSLLLSSHNVEIMMNWLSKNYDYILIDTPPFKVAPDSSILSKYADGILLVVSPGITSLIAVEETVNSFHDNGSNIFGIVLNRTSSNYYYYKHNDRESKANRLKKLVQNLPFLKPPADSDLISMNQTAQLLGVHRKTIKRWRLSGQIKADRKYFRWWVKRQEIQNFVQDNKESANPPDSIYKS